MRNAYIKWASLNGVQHEELYRGDGKVTLKFTGKDVWKLFKHESGKHCVQRIPPTESKGRKQTSYISVAVLPYQEDNDIELDMDDVKIKTQGGHGKGGQHQNATDSAVRAKHEPSGTEVFINGRKQYANKKLALKILFDRINEVHREKQHEEYNDNKRNQVGNSGRSGKVRTYNFINSRVVDHKLNKKTNKIKDIMRGRFNVLFN